jgi:phosphatidylglycerophosphate synthase
MTASIRRAAGFQELARPPIGDTLLGLVALGAAALALETALGLDAAFAYKALTAFALAGALVAVLAKRHLNQPFGAANRITLVRAALVALLAAFVGEGATLEAVWGAIGLALAVLLLDGVDGGLARRHGTVSAFGARFDMETDAAFILVLTVLALSFGKVGIWILASGLMRYAFVAASAMLEFLRRPLPYSRRRQTVCVVQVVSLLVCLAPFVPPPLSDLVALAGLVTLAASFAVDVAWLTKHKP